YAFGAAEFGDAFDFERDMAADVDDDRSPGPMPSHLCLEVGERDAEIVAIAVDVLDGATGRRDGQWVRHKRVRPAENNSAVDVCDSERCQRRTGPAGHRDRAESVPVRPRLLEFLGHWPLRPDVPLQDVVPERMQHCLVAWVEPDREPVERQQGPRRRHASETLLWLRGAVLTIV